MHCNPLSGWGVLRLLSLPKPYLPDVFLSSLSRNQGEGGQSAHEVLGSISVVVQTCKKQIITCQVKFFKSLLKHPSPDLHTYLQWLVLLLLMHFFFLLFNKISFCNSIWYGPVRETLEKREDQEEAKQIHRNPQEGTVLPASPCRHCHCSAYFFAATSVTSVLYTVEIKLCIQFPFTFICHQ